MAVTSSLNTDESKVTISISGRFDFSAHQDFRTAYEKHTGCAVYEIDLRETTYLDSSALGMLLLLRDHAGGDKSRVEVVNCNADVRKILAISNFEQLFKVS